MESNLTVDVLGAVLMVALWGVAILTIGDLVYRYATDAKDDPVKEGLADYRRDQAQAQRNWREFVRGYEND